MLDSLQRIATHELQLRRRNLWFLAAFVVLSTAALLSIITG